MQDVIRAFGQALKGIFHPWVIWLSVRPFLIGATFWFVILWFSWTPLLDWMRSFMTNSAFALGIANTLSQVGWGDSLRAIVAPYFSVVVLMPLIIVSILVIVSFTSVTSVLRHVERQSLFAGLKKERGGSFLGSLWVCLSSTFIFLVLVVITLPIWWVPPVFAMIPPILWGWLTARLMTYDVLSRHASKIEREILLKRYQVPLLVMGIIAGMMGAIPTFFWLSSVFILVLFPFVSILMMWLYSLVFIFAALWFTHYLLFALKEHRDHEGVVIGEQ